MRLHAVAFFLSLSALALTGCSLSPTAPGTSAVTGAAIHGVLHGGQQPFYNSHIYLFTPNTGGEPARSAMGSNSFASISLLNNSVLTNNSGASGEDSNNDYYVTTDASGSFSHGRFQLHRGL
jgi:hypothetical protein